MSDQPFMSIVTRCCMRPQMLSDNIESVLSQTCHDLEQLFLVDHTRQGIQAADRSLGEHRDQVRGRYVYILDDDCCLIDPGFVERIKSIVEEAEAEPGVINPALLMVESRRPPGPPSMSSVVPTAKAWESRTLYHGACNCLCYVADATLWKFHIHNFGIKPWGGDWWFLEAMLSTNPAVLWASGVVADCRQLGRGRIFETNKTDWFAPVAKEHGLEKITDDVWRLPLWIPD